MTSGRHEGEVLESFVTKTRDKAATLKFIKKAMKRHGKAEAITTDGLRSYGSLTCCSKVYSNKLSTLGLRQPSNSGGD